MVSPRQAEILTLAAQGLEKTQIAERLGMATGTVRTQMERARKHLDAHNTAHAVAKYQAFVFKQFNRLTFVEDETR